MNKKIVQVDKTIVTPYYERFGVQKSGLVAISMVARCKSRTQAGKKIDENLRIELNQLAFRENPLRTRNQFFDTPAAFNGSLLKNKEKTVVLLTLLDAGTHTLGLIPKQGAYIKKIIVEELSGTANPFFEIDSQPEDGDRRPWYTFILIDLPIRLLLVDATIRRRKHDSDDIKVVADGMALQTQQSIKYRFWSFIGELLQIVGASFRKTEQFETELDSGIHYLELFVDRMPLVHAVRLVIEHHNFNERERATGLVQAYKELIKGGAKEFDVDPVMIGAVIHQDQATNVNFVDTLFDNIGGLAGINTSIGIGQVRVKTAREPEQIYDQLGVKTEQDSNVNKNMARVERLKDPWINIRYVAAKIKFSQDRWRNAGFDISTKPEILGTLYNIEDVAHPVDPHENPQANDFGKGVSNNYSLI